MKTIRIISLILLIVIAVNALVAGYLFITDPSGSKLYMSVTWLEHSPFSNFLIPGIVLFIVNGIMNLIAATFVLFKWKNWKELILLQGNLLTGWIIVQVIMLQTVYFLHFIFAATGILLIFFSTKLRLKNE